MRFRAMSRAKITDARPSAQAGMSLIEILVVISVLGMLVLVGLPAMELWAENYRIRTAATEIAMLMQQQRMRAVAQNRDFAIGFDTEASTYNLYDGDPASGGTLMDAAARPLPIDVTFDAVDFTSDRVLFHPDGSANGGTASDRRVRIENGNGEQFEVIVNELSGRVRVEKLSS